MTSPESSWAPNQSALAYPRSEAMRERKSVLHAFGGVKGVILLVIAFTLAIGYESWQRIGIGSAMEEGARALPRTGGKLSRGATAPAPVAGDSARSDQGHGRARERRAIALSRAVRRGANGRSVMRGAGCLWCRPGRRAFPFTRNARRPGGSPWPSGRPRPRRTETNPRFRMPPPQARPWTKTAAPG